MKRRQKMESNGKAISIPQEPSFYRKLRKLCQDIKFGTENGDILYSVKNFPALPFNMSFLHKTGNGFISCIKRPLYYLRTFCYK